METIRTTFDSLISFLRGHSEFSFVSRKHFLVVGTSVLASFASILILLLLFSVPFPWLVAIFICEFSTLYIFMVWKGVFSLESDIPNFNPETYVSQFSWGEEEFNKNLDDAVQEQEIPPEEELSEEEADRQNKEDEEDGLEEDTREIEGEESFLKTQGRGKRSASLGSSGYGKDKEKHKETMEKEKEKEKEKDKGFFSSWAPLPSSFSLSSPSPSPSPSTSPIKPRISSSSSSPPMNPKKMVVIAVLGDVSSGKTSLLRALFSVSPDDHQSNLGKSLVVHSALSSLMNPATTCQVVYLQKDVILVDLPGLHGSSASVVPDSVKQFLQPGILDVALFVTSREVTSTTLRDFQGISSVAKKVYVIRNKIDELDYLKDVNHIVEQWKTTLGVDEVFLTAAKGHDPDTERSSPHWLDIRGVTELREAILTYLRRSKKSLLMSKHLHSKNEAATEIILGACTRVFFQTFAANSAVQITATQMGALNELYFLYTGGRKLGRNLAQSVLLSTSDNPLSQSLYYFAQNLIPAPQLMVNFVSAVISAGSVVCKTASILIAAQQLLRTSKSLKDRR